MAALVAQIDFNAVTYNRSNLNIPWKGKTFNQISSKLQKNGMDQGSRTSSRNDYFHPLPLKIYRREIVTNTDSSYNVCNSRSSSSIDIFDMPNGTIVNSSNDANANGLVNTIDMTLPNNTCERPGTCKAFLSPADAAKRRVRSAGMIKRQFDISKNNDTYYTNSNQYLVSRNRTFSQNQYNFIKSGDATVKPGDGLSSQNVYAPNGINHCAKYHIAANTSFQYQWLDKQFYTVDISSGYYAVEDLNNRFNLEMLQNDHYYVNLANGNKVFLMYFAYNSFLKKMEIHTLKVNDSIFNTSTYRRPYAADYDQQTERVPRYITSWTTPSVAQSSIPVIVILNNAFRNAIGFSAGHYPSVNIPTNFTTGPFQDVSQRANVFLSPLTPGIRPTFVSVVYKPSNPQFASQGGVSASSLIARTRYNEITRNSKVFMNALGVAVGNAMAYGVPENGYTIKDKIGYPLRKTPKFSKFSTTMKCETCNTWDTHATTKST